MQAIGFIIYGFPLYTKFPAFECKLISDGLDPLDVCIPENICTNDSRIKSWEVDYTDRDSLHNWFEKLDLMCQPSWKIGAIGSSFFIGWCLTLLWVPRLADIHGR